MLPESKSIRNSQNTVHRGPASAPSLCGPLAERGEAMAIAGDCRILGSLAAPPGSPLRLFRPSMEIQCGGPFTGRSNRFQLTHKYPAMDPLNRGPGRKCYQCFGFTGNQVSTASINKDIEAFLLNAIDMNFFDRLSLAWRIVFPTTTRRNSDATIAKQRLKMILFSDRCAVSDEAKQKIVSNIVDALSDFVEIDSQDKVQLSVSTDPDLGTVYSVTVPVRRVKPGYRESDEVYTGITGVEYKDTGETSGNIDVKFDFSVPGGI